MLQNGSLSLLPEIFIPDGLMEESVKQKIFLKNKTNLLGIGSK